jgi:cytochrome c biogenesis protein CcdA
MMHEIWTTLIPILLADALNPVLFAFMVYAAGSDRPVLNSAVMLAGHTTAYFIAGIALSFGMESIAERLANPKQIDFVIELIVGVILLWVAWKSRGMESKDPEDSSPRMTPISAFGLGITINFIGIPFAVPYFAALSQILKLDPTLSEALTLLVGYNILYALPFTIVPILIALLGDRGKPILESINNGLNKASAFLMPIILGLVALALIADAAVYFWSGESLF